MKEKIKIVFDVETTGLDPKEDEILQLSIINGQDEVLYNSYFRPIHRISWTEAQRVNGITPEMVQNSPTIEDEKEKIQSIFDSADELIAYNGSFDMKFLAAAGIKMPDVPYADVMLDFAEVYGEWNDYFQGYKWQKLSTCAKYYGYEFSAHDSLEDVKATLFAYQRMKEQ